MAKCNNCNKTLNCSCKRRTAKDGTSCCATCIAGYERKAKSSGSTNTSGTILNVTAEQKK